MKLLSALLFIFLVEQSFCQVRFPEVYCNGEKVSGDHHMSGYFTPLQYEFKFPASDSTYVIKEGKILYHLKTSKDSVFFNSNKLYSDVLAVSDSIRIYIYKTDVYKNGQLIRTDSSRLSKKIKFQHHHILTQAEAKVINNNDVILYIDGTAFDFNAALTKKYRTYWQISLKQKETEDGEIKTQAEAKKWDLLLVRGNSPIYRLVSDGLTCEVKSIWTMAKRGDFIRITVKVKGLPQRYLYKVIFIE
ncbi:MAG: hypothetical protein ACJ75J_03185 [Cytophagaceae bacterium]